jgi:hypothetical protein
MRSSSSSVCRDGAVAAVCGDGAVTELYQLTPRLYKHAYMLTLPKLKRVLRLAKLKRSAFTDANHT